MNHRIETPHRLLGDDGALIEPGWATKLIMEYSPFDVKAHKIRIKEWDYYIIIDSDGYAFSVTVDDNRYMGLINSNFFDLNNKKKHTFITPLLFPMGRLNLPTNSESGDIFLNKNYCSLSITHEKNSRRILGKYTKCPVHGEIEFDITLNNHGGDTMVIATPWKEDKTAFYYNQKVNCMPAEGYVKFDGKTHLFSPEKAFATLDWGRGVWTYDNTWYWSSCNGLIDGKLFGFNFGYGFGDNSSATENMLFYDGKAHKLDKVLFDIPDSINDPWRFISTDGRIDLDFFPLYADKHKMSAGIISQNGHQVFGKFYGTVILDNGKELYLDGLTAFAEKMRNKY